MSSRLTWPARLTLQAEDIDGRSRLTGVRHHGPLRIQRPFYPEGPDLAHVYLLHPPAGLVAGDQLDIEVTLCPGAALLLTAPGAAKAYRSEGGEAVLNQVFKIAPGARLENLPHELILFDAARLKQTTTVHLDRQARYLAWETLCLGRPEASQAFVSGSCDVRTDILLEGKWLFRDRQYWAEGTLNFMPQAVALDCHPYYASLYAYPAEAQMVEALRFGLGHQLIRQAATVVDGLLVLRLLGMELPSIRQALLEAWRILRPLWSGRMACPPRIWST